MLETIAFVVTGGAVVFFLIMVLLHWNDPGPEKASKERQPIDLSRQTRTTKEDFERQDYESDRRSEERLLKGLVKESRDKKGT